MAFSRKGYRSPTWLLSSASCGWAALRRSSPRNGRSAAAALGARAPARAPRPWLTMPRGGTWGVGGVRWEVAQFKTNVLAEPLVVINYKILNIGVWVNYAFH